MGTKVENMQHAVQYSLLHPRKGAETGSSKHTAYQIHMVCKMLENPALTVPDIVAATGVTINTVRGILYRGKWKDISSKYDFSCRKHLSKPLDYQTKLDMRTLAIAGYETKEIIHALDMPVTSANITRTNRCIRPVRTFNDHPGRE